MEPVKGRGWDPLVGSLAVYSPISAPAGLLQSPCPMVSAEPRLSLQWQEWAESGHSGLAGEVGEVGLGRAAAASLSRSAGFLNGRTRHIAVRAEHAAIALQRAQDRTAMPTIVEKLTGIGRHRLRRYAAALRAS